MVPKLDDAAEHVVATAAPSNIRWRILMYVTIVQFITYVDRLNLSIAGHYIQDEFGIGTQTMGWVLSAFLVGYALMQIPGGWLGDRFGPRNILTFAIVWWSIFTALTGVIPGFFSKETIHVVWSLMIVRLLVGVGEAASSPNLNKIVSNWIGSAHRGIGSSFTILGIGLGGSITPPLIAWLMRHYGWRTSFVLAGAVGIVVAFVWRSFVTDRPEQHRGVDAAELAALQRARGSSAPLQPNTNGLPWKQLLSNRSVWGLVLGYLCQGFPIYFYHTWFFIYLVRVRGLSVEHGSLWGTTPYIAIAALAPLGGWFSDRAAQRLGKRNGRRLAVWTGMGSSAVLLWLGSHTAAPLLATALLALGAGFNMFAAVTFWATCIDLSPSFTGSVSGLMNTFGNLGGWLSPIVTAYIAVRYGWDKALYCAAAVTLASGLFFSLVQADQTVDGELRRSAEAT